MQLIRNQIRAIQTLLEDLKRESELKSTIILVEGTKDLQALRQFGIQGNILHFQGRNLPEICDLGSEFKKIIILTDFDRTGQNLAKKIHQNLISRGLNGDLTFYHKFKFYFKKVSKDIESLLKIYHEIEQTNINKQP